MFQFVNWQNFIAISSVLQQYEVIQHSIGIDDDSEKNTKIYVTLKYISFWKVL